FGLQAITRPFETLFLVVCAAPFVRRRHAIVLAALAPFLLLTLAQNKAVTGSFTTLPYMLSRNQYGVPATFTFQPNAVAHRELNQEQKLACRAESEVHGDAPETIGKYMARLGARVKFLRFFFLPPLYLALLFAIPSLREPRCLWAAGSIALFVLGSNFYSYFYPHYIAAVTCLMLLFAMAGLARLSRINRDAMRILALLCFTHFAMWYGIHLFGNEAIFTATGPYESWDFVNFGDSEGRRAVEREISAAQGRQLVFVRFGPSHLLREWQHNDADIDGSRVVWALDLGAEEDEKLVRYYPDRGVWLLQPDAYPPSLTPWVPGQ
ncbi:MAG: hypothetical protein KGN84_17485, partial [Acidobacteriota bacterium]|nr:hypothetical protein [Acidobacteriota bacterium]